MCRGIEERRNELGNFCRKTEDSNCMKSETVRCELCGSRAYLYCQADDAFLCRKCDKWVHEANFLALRHIRCFLCNACQNLTNRYLVANSVEMVLPPLISLRDEPQETATTINDDDFPDEQQCSASLKMPFLFL